MGTVRVQINIYFVWIIILERKERERKEGKRNGREITFVCIGGNGRERKRDESFPFKSFQPWRDWNLKNIHQILPTIFPPNPSLPFCYPNKRFFLTLNPSPSFSSIFFHPNTPLVSTNLAISYSSDVLLGVF